jgi:hypothetical protein
LKEIIIDNFSILPKEILIEIICKLIEDEQLDTVEKAEIICNMLDDKTKQKIPYNAKKWKFSEEELFDIDEQFL